MLETDPKLAMFILDMRSKSPEQIDTLVMDHKKSIARKSNTKDSNIIYLHERNLFLIANGYQMNTVEIAKATHSKNKNIKALGYMAATFIKDKNFGFQLINSIRNDLISPESCLYPLVYMSNSDISDPEFMCLENIISMININHNVRKISLVLSCDMRMSLKGFSFFEKKQDIFYTKLQIVIDYFNHHDCPDFGILQNREEINFVTSYFRKTDKFYLRTKCVQLFVAMAKRSIFLDQIMLKYIDDSISLIRLLKKSFGEVAYYLEAVEYLAFCGYETHKINTFVFKLLESNNKIYIQIGIRISMKYSIYRDIAIEKCIKTGLLENSTTKWLINMITKENYKEIYQRKESVIQIMESIDIPEAIIQSRINLLMRRILNFTEEDEIVSFIMNEPLLAVKYFDNGIPQKTKNLIFRNCKDKNDPIFFSLVYHTISLKDVRREVVDEIVKRHFFTIKAMLQDGEKEYILATLDHLLKFIFLSDQDEQLYKADVIELAKDMINKGCSEDLKTIMMHSIHRYNTLLDEKQIFLDGSGFLTYSISFLTGNALCLNVRCPSSISILEAIQNSQKMNVLSCHSDDNHISKSFEIVSGKNIKMMAYKHDHLYEMSIKAT